MIKFRIVFFMLLFSNCVVFCQTDFSLVIDSLVNIGYSNLKAKHIFHIRRLSKKKAIQEVIFYETDFEYKHLKPILAKSILEGCNAISRDNAEDILLECVYYKAMKIDTLSIAIYKSKINNCIKNQTLVKINIKSDSIYQ